MTQPPLQFDSIHLVPVDGQPDFGLDEGELLTWCDALINADALSWVNPEMMGDDDLPSNLCSSCLAAYEDAFGPLCTQGMQ